MVLLPPNVERQGLYRIYMVFLKNHIKASIVAFFAIPQIGQEMNNVPSYICIYIYIERERERKKGAHFLPKESE